MVQMYNSAKRLTEKYSSEGHENNGNFFKGISTTENSYSSRPMKYSYQ